MKELRLDHKLKQTEVAEIIGVAISTYCNYEYGQREPSASTIITLAKLYQVPSDYLLGLDEPAPEEKAKIILASNSPRRKELLERIGVKDFKVAAPNVDESVEDDLSPAEIVERLSLRKARAAAKKAGPDDLIIAADTVVALDDKVLGKPHDEADAFAMLSALSGREHHVYTGVTVLRGEEAVTQHEETAVTFRAIRPDEIRGYIATGEPMDKAGAYGIQERGALLVSGIHGDYFNVMGLPVFRLGRILAQFGVDLLSGNHS
ncbi:MAG: Maf family nucleotide pyrophosphatase [Oscillospiraceae bacterium]|nr:Maf family nucleotide pyrophosphatase [Oscillospiraceae bacterium]